MALRTDRDVARARREVGRALDERGARTLQRTRFVTAVSEIARNAVLHGGGGTLSITERRDRPGLEVLCRDRGPGIPDIGRALEDGFTTGRGLGRGLGGAKRLSDAFDIASEPGAGTTVRLSVRF